MEKNAGQTCSIIVHMYRPHGVTTQFHKILQRKIVICFSSKSPRRVGEMLHVVSALALDGGAMLAALS